MNVYFELANSVWLCTNTNGSVSILSVLGVLLHFPQAQNMKLNFRYIFSARRYFSKIFKHNYLFQLGDVISLVKRRDDGWCKGTLHR